LAAGAAGDKSAVWKMQTPKKAAGDLAILSAFLIFQQQHLSRKIDLRASLFAQSTGVGEVPSLCVHHPMWKLFSGLLVLNWRDAKN